MSGRSEISSRFIPVIDIFAGPGGLGEGFHQFRASDGSNPFKITLSIEKELFAYQTLRMRSFFRQFPGEVPREYYDAIQTELPDWALLEQEFKHEMTQVDEEVWHAELGRVSSTDLSSWVANAIGRTDKWVLIGGPPCQAYSTVGRARMSRQKWHFARDPRHTLYVEYLRMLAVHHPAVFVMENVKGILSSRKSGELIVDQILNDLQRPCGSTESCRNHVSYKIYAVADYEGNMGFFLGKPGTYMVESEKHGIPQARHRFILVGVREDIDAVPEVLKPQPPVAMWNAIRDLPALRSRLSRNDSAKAWANEIARINEIVIKSSNGFVQADLRNRLLEASGRVRSRLLTGGHFCEGKSDPQWRREWFYDPRLQGVLNHCSRAHIPSDLWRYLYASVFAEVHDRSPKLRDFPRVLWPAHRNLVGARATEDLAFDDRFRVQVKTRPATTITSHISKDGHYFIHPDPRQCRTLTVREAARLQTFPDNYVFLGPRTAQYQQVGNAVPPLLALQIAEIVKKLI